MGGFVNTLGQVGQNIAQNASNRSPMFRALYQRYMSGRQVSVPGQGPMPVGPGGAGGAPQGPGIGMAAPAPQMGSEAEEGMDLGDVGAPVDEAAARGTVVTKPTIAKIGEDGPEAVVPLTPRPGNKMQPDILEGRGVAPAVPGVHYSRYKGYNRFGGGAGGSIA